MAITLPCQNITSLNDRACTTLGSFRAAPNASVEPGQARFTNGAADATGVYTISNVNPSGINVSSLFERLEEDDELTVSSATGDLTVTVVDVTVGASSTVIDVTYTAGGTLPTTGEITTIYHCVEKV